jgi:prepilin-type N-terminal cleavage/methylation domain-containing protein
LSNAAGFTLVEAMIALLVFGIGFLALAQGLPRGLEARDRGRRMSVATNLAQEQMERLRSRPFTHGDLAAGTHADPDNPLEGAYRRRWAVLDGVPTPGMKRVVVTVAFPTAHADSEAVVTTLIGR